MACKLTNLGACIQCTCVHWLAHLEQSKTKQNKSITKTSRPHENRCIARLVCVCVCAIVDLFVILSIANRITSNGIYSMLIPTRTLHVALGLVIIFVQHKQNFACRFRKCMLVHSMLVSFALNVLNMVLKTWINERIKIAASLCTCLHHTHGTLVVLNLFGACVIARANERANKQTERDGMDMK